MDIVCKSELTSLKSLSEHTQKIAPLLPGGVAIGLFGPLGAGKTEFVRGILRGLGVRGAIPSPSFVLECEYEIPAGQHSQAHTAHHWDLYRLRGHAVPQDLIEHLEDESKLLFVEWPEAIEEYLGVKIILDFFGETDGGKDEAPSSRLMEISLSPSLCETYFDVSEPEKAKDEKPLDFDGFCSLLAKTQRR